MEYWDKMGFGNFPVTEISHSTIALSDGTNLGMKVWLPCLVSQITQKFPYFEKQESIKWSKELYVKKMEISTLEAFPTILEYLPYPKDAQTLSRDHKRHPWFCSHGYVVLRVDLRGSGMSSGLYYDEYELQEIEDCLEVLDWVGNQPWSNKAVGMYGKSWGGFNGLQIAYKQPSFLKAVISLYSTDDRYANDIHYQGGTVIGNGMMSWAASMFTINGRPPNPRYFSNLNEWKSFWLQRLQKTGKSFLSSWLNHQTPLDPFWHHGSIYRDYSKVQCPVLVIGGLVDSYTNAAFRMAGKLNQESKTIIGPWSHNWPDVSCFGPNIDYLNICLQWWDYHLKGVQDIQSHVTLWPRLSLYCRNSFKHDNMFDISGEWIDIPRWDSLLKTYQSFRYEDHSAKLPENLNILYFGDSMVLQDEKSSSPIDPVELHPHALQGVDAGLWLIIDNGTPGDQSTANQHSACWKSSKLQNNVVFTGFSKLYVTLSSINPGSYSIQVRICDQFPSGESTLVTKGCLNLCHSDLKDDDGWIKPYSGERKIFCVDIDGTGHIFPAGHELLISISPTYFPSIYPAIDKKGLFVHPEDTFVVFQTTSDLNSTMVYQKPKPLLQLPTAVLTKPNFSLTTELLDDGKFQTTLRNDSGLTKFPTVGLEEQTCRTESYTTDKEVSTAEMFAENCLISNFQDQSEKKISTKVETRIDMGGLHQRFWTKEYLKVSVDDEIIFEKSWDDKVPRKYV